VFVERIGHERFGQFSEVVLEEAGHRVRILLGRQVHVLALVEPGCVFVHEHRTAREPEDALHRQYCEEDTSRLDTRVCAVMSRLLNVLRSLSM
jgi:hypothetical protein